jgi:hypothetical protein
VLEAECGFRKLVGYGAMPILIAAPGSALYIDARRIRATASRIAGCAQTIAKAWPEVDRREPVTRHHRRG